MDQTTQLQQYLDQVQPYLDKYGYLALFVGVMVEGFGIPAPGQTLIMATALIAARGQMNVIIVFTLGWAAAVIGDNIGYAIGHYGGRRVILRQGRFVGVRAGHIEKVTRFFCRWGGGIVIVARFFEVLRQLNGVVAGLSAMPWKQFLVYNALGAALWVGAWGSAAYFLGAKLNSVLTWFDDFAPYVIVAGLAGLFFLIVFIVWKKNNNT